MYKMFIIMEAFFLENKIQLYFNLDFTRSKLIIVVSSW